VKRVQDYYFKKAKKEGYAARSVYKLLEAQVRHRFLRHGQMVLDLGASPGAWTRYAAEVVGKEGRVVSVDVQNIAVSAGNVVTVQKDVLNADLEDFRAFAPAFDVVLSDMAPKTTGSRAVDHIRSVSLASRALALAEGLLRPGGTLYCKVFQGSEFPSFRRRCGICFDSVKAVKPKSSRPESVEIFLLCTGFKQGPSGW